MYWFYGLSTYLAWSSSLYFWVVGYEFCQAVSKLCSIFKYSFIFSLFLSYYLFRVILRSSTLLAMNIPRPCEPDSGLQMKRQTGSFSESASVILPSSIFCFLISCFFFANSWISWNSAGYIQVCGKKLKWSGNSFWNLFKCIPNVLFLQILYIPRKWFTLCVHDKLLRNSGDIPLSAQNISHASGLVKVFEI